MKRVTRIVRVLIFGLFTFLSGELAAQIFPGLEGEVLVEALQNAYTPQFLLNDTQVKDTLYAKVFIEDDSVRCIYSGLAHDLPIGVDPSQYIFGSGNQTESINLEHGWPQAKGAGDGTDGNMNMYHLFPSRVAINSDRADFPYRQIADNVTNHWYYLGIEMSAKPNTNIDAYSEFVSGSFEPRESVKGDIARAMFYFWTIYRDDAVAADPNYFDQMKADLCTWHEQDPADEFELLRNDRVAVYQDGKINPFITDCSLVRRAYCIQLDACVNTSTEEHPIHLARLEYDVNDQQLLISGEESMEWQLFVINLLGQVMFSEHLVSGESIDVLQLRPGFYYAIASDGKQNIMRSFFKF